MKRTRVAMVKREEMKRTVMERAPGSEEIATETALRTLIKKLEKSSPVPELSFLLDPYRG